MASTIVTKNSSTASAVPVSGDLTQGELAVNVTDKRLFTKNSGGTVVELGTNPASLALPNGTANGVAYLNGSKVVTTGSALTFDGTNLGVGTATLTNRITVKGADSSSGGINILGTGSNGLRLFQDGSGGDSYISNYQAGSLIFAQNNSEGMRLTSTGLGIGTSSPASKLDVQGAGAVIQLKQNAAGSATYYVMDNTVETGGKRWRFGYSGAAGIPCFSLYNQTDNVTSWVADASGNLGLGVTPSAWLSTFAALDIKTGGLGIVAGTDYGAISLNAYYSGTTWKYKATSSNKVTLYDQYNGIHSWYTAASGTAGNTITFTQAMTLDASGNLLVGITSGSYKFMVGDGTRDMCINPNSSLDGTFLGTIQSKPLIFGTGNTERARIDSSGNLLVGVTTVNSANGFSIAPSTSPYVTLNKSATGTKDAFYFEYNGAIVGKITYSDTATAYNTSSDYRLKNSVAPMTGALARVAALKPVTYKWNADNSDGEGFIAHELAEVCPLAVAGEKDAVDEEGNPQYQGIDTSFLVATLTAAIQEQQAIIEQLKADVAALKGA